VSERALRGWWIALTLAIAAFAAYISLVPFGFVHPPPGMSAIDAVRARLETHVGSKSNLLANGLMFVPFGLFGLAIFVDEQSRWWRWLLAGACVLMASMTLSITIEAAQAFVPGRTPSVIDVMAQTAGTIVGGLAWRGLAHEIRSLVTRYAAGSRRALETAFVAYGLSQFVLLLEPFDISVEPEDLVHKYRAGEIVWNPLRSSALHLAEMTSVLADMSLAIPVGMMMALVGTPAGTRRSISTALAAGAVFYAAGEFAQCFVRGRTADIVDLLANIAGMAVGVMLTAIVAVPRHEGRPSPGPQRQRWAIAAIIFASLFYVAYNWAPFDFQVTREMVTTRAGLLAGVPFFGYYVNPEFKAMRDLLTKVSMALPFGLIVHFGFRPDRSRYPRFVAAGWLLAGSMFFAAVEVGQVFLPSRYPDDTDILIAVVSMWLGIHVARPFMRGTTAAERTRSDV
jgi:VanZ family protein